MFSSSKKEETKKPQTAQETKPEEKKVSARTPLKKVILTRPWLSEKAHRQMAENQYTFLVDRRSTKPEVKKAVEDRYEVNVLSVDTLPIRGKTRHFRGLAGNPRDRKKAIVTIQSGQRIEEGF